ncbi:MULTISPECIES: flagellar assembly protein FliX [unclassified Thalassospira]|uniref:flagellar assembly protein FliX n=1 Tax=unclassified Thalassospira TaxID=2648997 RepID=UPI0007A60B5E|nr:MULTISPECIES: flagellar assembly protein FliX [unclassified Thalassospira]KZD00225.1 flagellar assembly protein FliX [Thalassospira sp. MCCC 1A02898]ONH87116.1 flagellar assembly protein FliX [Thalassospira sp. MCCC 1A02803]
MKVSGSKAAGTSTSSRKKSSGTSGGSSFADAMRSLDSSGDAGGAAGVRSAGAVSALDALLALQQSGDALDSPKKAAMLRAKSMLEQLEAVRDGLLSGQLSPARLQQLVGLLDQQREMIDDPELSSVLDEIDLRARVELAKLEVSGLI